MHFLNNHKSTPVEIKKKFDGLVESYSDLEAGQRTAVDSTLIADLIACTVHKLHPGASDILDIGCGAGNYSLRIATCLANARFTLLDLSDKMLSRAEERLKPITTGKITSLCSDIRDVVLPENCFDAVVAGTSLHHLREEDQWHNVFSKIYKALKKGGSFWISDLIVHDTRGVNDVVWQKYDEFLLAGVGKEQRKWVYEQMELEDTPRSLNFQTDVLQTAGFGTIEILHKNANFAAFGGIK
jgi:tRNA (cmo5U34)-methyltransferase